MDPRETTQETLISTVPAEIEAPKVPETERPAAPELLARLQALGLRGRAIGASMIARLIAWRDNQRLWQRLAQVRHLRLIFVVIFLVAFVAPLLTLGATALVQYNQLKAWGADGVAQLTSIKELLPTSSATSDGGSNTTVQKAKDVLNKDTLNSIKRRCLAAQSDFLHINSAIANREGIIGMALGSPYKSKIVAVQQLAIIGIDGTILCDKLTTLGLDFTNSFQTSPFSSDGAPLLTAKSFADLQLAVDEAEPILVDINAHLRATNLDELPVNAKQIAQVRSVADHLPKYLSDLDTFK
ncbi:MAG: hypothetical protein H0X24_13355, partial [Ktedonobacterales bacterium]|nr:hypothetical protein [Ktedonobacterales bacterium]